MGEFMFLERCRWVTDDPIYIEYHDIEWGVPVHDDQRLFEMLILEGAQAGLSWITILKKRPHYRLVFDNFDAAKIVSYDLKKRESLLQDPGIIRNRLKINAAITNAEKYLEICEQKGSFDHYLWSFVEGVPLKNHWQSSEQIPSSTPLSDKISKDLKKRGFKFVGTTIIYAFLQAVGVVDDHLVSCFKRNN